MKKKFMFITGVLMYIGLALVFSSYDNATMHKYINEEIMDAFVKKYPGDPELKNYLFSASEKIKGEGVTEAGYYYHNEGTLEKTIEEWIIHGGFSADEPELLQALRHFYDPKGNDGGKMYLTDFPPGLSVTNPNIHILEWALEYEGEIIKGTDGPNYLFQEHSWEDGKRSIMDAMQEKDEVKQNKLMAHAWRSLGETLHALADMACPVHVRNDGHATGDADPYENAIVNSSYLPSDPSAFWDQALMDDLKSKGDMQQLFHAMALYTNEHFFTNQTIYGDGVEKIKPVIRPDNPYTLPYAKESGDGWDYHHEDFTFYKGFGGNQIKMAKDRYYFAGVVATNDRTKKAYVDLDVAISQSKVLLSNLIGIGPEIIKRYTPILKVELGSIDDNSSDIWGYVTIDKTTEYPLDRKYNSMVTIFNNSTGKSIKVECNDGYFSSEDLDFSEGDELVAYISLGGLKVYSDTQTTGGSPYKQMIEKCNDIFLSFGLQDVLYNNGMTGSLGLSSYTKEDFDWDNVEYTLNGDNLIINKERTWQDSYGTNSIIQNFTFTFSNDFRDILSFRYNSESDTEDMDYKRTTNVSFVLENISYDYTTWGDFIRYNITNEDMKNNFKDLNYTYTFLNKNKQETTTETIEQIDWTTGTYSDPNACTLWFWKIE